MVTTGRLLRCVAWRWKRLVSRRLVEALSARGIFWRTVFVHMVAMLMMEMSVVHVIYVAVVLHGFMTVSFVMSPFRVLVNDFFGVVLTIMNVVNVPVVLDGLVAVPG